MTSDLCCVDLFAHVKPILRQYMILDKQFRRLLKKTRFVGIKDNHQGSSTIN